MSVSTRHPLLLLRALRILLAFAFIAAGVLHFVKPDPYLAIMPPWLPAHALLVQISGVAEFAGGLGLLLV